MEIKVGQKYKGEPGIVVVVGVNSYKVIFLDNKGNNFYSGLNNFKENFKLVEEEQEQKIEAGQIWECISNSLSYFTKERYYRVDKVDSERIYLLDNDDDECYFPKIIFLRDFKLIGESFEIKDSHYNNEHGSIYKFCDEQGLNSYEFDIIKRITRCRKKGQFLEDLEKTKRVIDLYIKEHDSNRN